MDRILCPVFVMGGFLGLVLVLGVYNQIEYQGTVPEYCRDDVDWVLCDATYLRFYIGGGGWITLPSPSLISRDQQLGS